MVLYSDLRLYTSLKQELALLKTGGTPAMYKKTGAEWEVYGDLSYRLDHTEEARESYKNCLEVKFSAKSLLRLLEINSKEGNILPTLTAAVKLVSVMDRTYNEATFPSPVARALFQIIKIHGCAKVHNALKGMNIPQKHYQLVSRFFEYAEAFQVDGWDS